MKIKKIKKGGGHGRFAWKICPCQMELVQPRPTLLRNLRGDSGKKNMTLIRNLRIKEMMNRAKSNDSALWPFK